MSEEDGETGPYDWSVNRELNRNVSSEKIVRPASLLYKSVKIPPMGRKR